MCKPETDVTFSSWAVGLVIEELDALDSLRDGLVVGDPHVKSTSEWVLVTLTDACKKFHSYLGNSTKLQAKEQRQKAWERKRLIALTKSLPVSIGQPIELDRA